MSEIIITIGDLETTGLKQESGHRIIEVSLHVWRYNTLTGACRKAGAYNQRINPMRDIDPAAQAVHGISLADLRGCPEWEDVAGKINKILAHSHIFVAHNAAFDAPFLALELIRVGYSAPKIEVFCTMENGRKATAMGKAPNLGELCWALEVDYDPDAAHAADYDVEVLTECYWRGINTGLFNKPETLIRLPSIDA